MSTTSRITAVSLLLLLPNSHPHFYFIFIWRSACVNKLLYEKLSRDMKTKSHKK